MVNREGMLKREGKKGRREREGEIEEATRRGGYRRETEGLND